MFSFLDLHNDNDFQYYDAEYNNKPQLRIMSNKDQPIRPLQEVPNPVLGFDKVIPAMKECVSFASSLREPNFIMPNQFEESVVTHHFTEVVEEFSRVLTHDYIPINVREKQSEISKAYAAPLISFLSKELPRFETGYSVLLLGAGSGKDVRRISMANPNFVKLVAVDPNVNELDKLRRVYPKAYCYTGTVRTTLSRVRKHGPFDLIVANMSFHYIFGVPSGFEVAKELPNLLTPRGLFFGSYVDVPSVKASSMVHFMKTGNSVQYLGERFNSTVDGEKPLNGVACISMAGVVFEDPYITVEQVYAMFEDVNVSVNVYHGSTMIKTQTDRAPLYPPPPGFDNVSQRPELIMYRAVVVTPGISRSFRDVGNAKVYLNEAPPSIRKTGASGLADRQYCVSYNKGVPLQPHEHQYVDADNMRIAVKRDGIMAKLIYSKRNLEIAAADGNCYKFDKFEGNYAGDFILQVEIVPSQTYKRHHVSGELGGFWVVVTDVLMPPWGATGPFASRWAWLQHVYGMTQWPFVLQEWVDLRSPIALELIHTAEEGIVLQSMLAPPGALKRGAGTAHYVKRRYTVDRRDDKGGISEYTLDGLLVRSRPDKDQPNTNLVIDKIKSAIPYNVFSLYLFFKYHAVIGSSWLLLLDHLSKHIAPKLWAIPERLLFFSAQYDPILNELFPDLMHHARLHFATQCMVDAVATERRVVSDDQFEGKLEYADDETAPPPVVDDKAPLCAWADDYVPPSYRTRGVLGLEWVGWISKNPVVLNTLMNLV